ncbi:hypothetical protein EON76_05240 [bacterium]|nr:MAG: hypothetical protein EON76_05240 [bacterium]
MSEQPNPGSSQAREGGCKCPILDNGHGRGYMGGVKDKNGDTMFVINEDCMMHNPPASKDGQND